MSIIRTRVRNGIKWLNKNYPGWRNRINTSGLDMGNCKFCIMGQVNGDFCNDARISENDALATRLGFNIPVTGGWEKNSRYMDRLSRAWVSELRTR